MHEGGGHVGEDGEGDGSENIAYAVPSMILEHFLTDHLSCGNGGALSGLPMLGLRWQRGESQALRQALGLEAHKYQGESGQVLTSSRQSGGERSVATLLYLIALQVT